MQALLDDYGKLIGMFVHVLEKNVGNTPWEIKNQGQVIGVRDGCLQIRRFSFVDGDPTDTVSMPFPEIPNHVFYATNLAMVDAWRVKMGYLYSVGDPV
ncbi:MAG: hypothetical protein ABW086_16015 [Sedimenticola sp.]